MIILHIIIGLNRGGAEMMLMRLVKHFNINKQPPRQVVISLTTLGDVGRILQSFGIEVYALNINNALTVGPKLWKLFKLIRAINPDIIQTWMYHADFFGGLIARLAGFKNIIWGIRCTDIAKNSSYKTKLLKKGCAFLSKYVPKLIVCAANQSRILHEKAGYDSSKMLVIPNGFDLSSFTLDPFALSDLMMLHNICDNNIIIGTVSRFNDAKDLHNFVKAAALISEKMLNVKFLIAGKNLDEKNKILSGWIKETGCAERFILLGERKDISTCFGIMDIFCLSSKTEGFPNVLGEAMAMRCLCVTTDVGDAAFLLGDCGVVVPKQCSQSLADGVLQLLNLPEKEQMHLRDLSHERIARNFTIDQARNKFEKIYDSLLDDVTYHPAHSPSIK